MSKFLSQFQAARRAGTPLLAIQTPDAEIPEVFRLRSFGMRQLEIAIVMGVGHVQISRILRGEQRRR